MTADHGRTVRRRQLSTELRQQREKAGLTQEQVAEAMDWSLSKLIRIEAGTVGVSTNDLKVLLDHYGLADAAEVDRLTAIARDTRQPSWWSRYQDVLAPQFATYLGYEAGAAEVRYFQPLVFPGILQTEEYARAIITGVGFGERPSPDRVDTLVTVRMTRREQVLLRRDPPRVRVVLEETVLRRPVAGPAVMAAQLAHVRTLASLDHLTLQVIPFERGTFPALQGAFTILDFPDLDDPGVLYLENASGQAVHRNKAAQLQEFKDGFEDLCTLSLGPAESAELLDHIAAEWTAKATKAAEG